MFCFFSAMQLNAKVHCFQLQNPCASMGTTFVMVPCTSSEICYQSVLLQHPCYVMGASLVGLIQHPWAQPQINLILCHLQPSLLPPWSHRWAGWGACQPHPLAWKTSQNTGNYVESHRKEGQQVQTQTQTCNLACAQPGIAIASICLLNLWVR